MAKVVEDESPDVVVADYASGAPFQMCKEKKIPLVLNLPLPGTLASCLARHLGKEHLFGKRTLYTTPSADALSMEKSILVMDSVDDLSSDP